MGVSSKDSMVDSSSLSCNQNVTFEYIQISSSNYVQIDISAKWILLFAQQISHTLVELVKDCAEFDAIFIMVSVVSVFACLVGRFNPIEKYARQIGNLPQIGVKIKNI